MEKLKHFFTTPLISSSTSKIIPLKHEVKPEKLPIQPKEFPREASSVNPKTLRVKKSMTLQSPTIKGRAKKYSLPLAIDLRPEATPFDFEAFEEVVDKKILALKKDIVNTEVEDSPSSSPKRSRSSSYAGYENKLNKKNNENNELPKRSKFAIPSPIQTINLNIISAQANEVIQSPLIRSPLNQSRDEMAGLLNEGDNSSLRKEKPISTLDLFQELKRKEQKEQKRHSLLESSDKEGLLSLRLTYENIETKTQVESKESDRKQENKEKYENHEVMKEESLLKRSLLVEQGDKKENLNLNVNELANCSSSSENSNLDSLVEIDPFEEFNTSPRRSSTVLIFFFKFIIP